MKKMKLLALAALVCAVISCGQGIPSGGNKEDEAVFTGNGILYYLTYNEEWLKVAKKAVTAGKAEYKDGMYISKELAVKDVSFTFRKDGTYSLKETEVILTTNDTYSYEEKGTYSISGEQLVCTYQCENETKKTLYSISYDGKKLVLKEPNRHEENEGISGLKKLLTFTQSSGALTVFNK